MRERPAYGTLGVAEFWSGDRLIGFAEADRLLLNTQAKGLR